MRIVVNHLTRMTAPRICVAGIETESFQHVRPTTPAYDLITRRLLRWEGGVFRVGTVVDLGPVTPEPARPESEDHRFQTHCARYVEDLADPEFLALLDEVAAPSLEDGFGPELERVGWKYAVEAGRGERSLAVVKRAGDQCWRLTTSTDACNCSSTIPIDEPTCLSRMSASSKLTTSRSGETSWPTLQDG